MMRSLNKIFTMFFMLLAACLALTLAPMPASAANSDFTSVTVAGANALANPSGSGWSYF